MIVKYLNGAALTKDNLDLANTQLLMLIQEMLDGLNENTLTLQGATELIRETVVQVTDILTRMEVLYEEVLLLLSSGGIISVEPRLYTGVGDGDTLDWPMVGADVADAAFYDTYVAGMGIIPNEDFSVLTTEDPADTMIHFETPVPDGTVWFTVLRGYAKPYAGPVPITNLDIPIFDAEGSTFFADEAVKYGIVRCTSAAGCTVTIKEINPLNPDRLNTGAYVSFYQRNSGPVSVTHDLGSAVLMVPGGCLPQTRAMGSVITAVCEDADSNLWVLGGDLAQE